MQKWFIMCTTLTKINVDSARTIIYYDATIFVPNTFTPDDNDFNQFFQAVVSNVSSYEMSIYNRWGMLVKIINKGDLGWDGTYNGLPSPDGVYVWKMEYQDIDQRSHFITGHLNLLR